MSNLSQPYPIKPYVLNRDTGPAFWSMGILWLPMATGVQTGNRLTLVEQEFADGPGPPAHYHLYDEGFYIIEGQFTFRVNGETHQAGPGTSVHIPRLMQHSFTVDAAPARVLNFYPSCGFELLMMGSSQLAYERRVPTPEECPPPPREQVEILFKLFGNIAVAQAASGPPSAEDYVTHPVAWSPSSVYLTTAKQSPAYAVLGSRWTLLVDSVQTAGSYSLLEQELAAQTTTNLQRHAEDEALYVLAGALQIVLDEQVVEAPAGSFVFIPAGTVHSLTAADETTRFLDFYLPGGFERGIVEFGNPLNEQGQPTGKAQGADIQIFFDQTGTRNIAARRKS